MRSWSGKGIICAVARRSLTIATVSPAATTTSSLASASAFAILTLTCTFIELR
eukprot:CAMPEP_0204545322 /NCGR_PEP_ID=MMETSP0661-20131031/21181_1 /ASSEMBLY_ACC=CAM_ASM_000606 /TAXON_ID=109239 /ORGANISM="Alexandrium margalefi, Strain AMGDE01CS-322" /LENGTH=52 /DNA_ID=CAMNT_0051552111 /DNA_START=5 /DNA_END=163 /DNA_ORIENTATION=-